jgi:hypothetical protein
VSHNSHTGRAAQDEPTQAAAAFDADAEFVFPGDMADDDGFAGGGCESEATDAGSAVDAPTPVSDGNNSSNDSGDDALIAAIAGTVATSRGEAFVQRLLNRLGGANIDAGGLAPLLRQLRLDLGDNGDETGAFVQFVDALDDPALDRDDLAHAVPVLAALTARAIVRGLEQGGGQVGAGAREHLAREAVTATRHLLRRRREEGLEPLPHVAGYLVRHALRRGAPPEAVANALPRIVARLTHEPALARRLVRAGAPEPDQTWRGTWGRPRRSVLHSPVEIAILAR